MSLAAVWHAASVHSNLLLVVFCCACVIGATTLLAVLPAKGHAKQQGDDGEDERTHSSMRSVLLSPRFGLRRKLQHVSSGLLILWLYLRAGVSSSQGSGCLLVSAAGLFAIHLLRARVPAVRDAFLALFGSLMRPHERAGAPPGSLFMLLGCGLVIELCGAASATGQWLGLSPVSADCAVTAAAGQAWSVSSWSGVVDIPALCMLCLSIGDPLASAIGQLLGPRDRHRVCGGKSLWAAAAMILTCTGACWALLHSMHTVATEEQTPESCAQPSTLSDTRGCDVQLASATSHLWWWSFAASLTSAAFELYSPTVLGLLPHSLDDNLRMPLLSGAALWLLRASGVLATSLRAAPHCYKMAL